MFRKALSAIVLLSLMLHCASRLGFLSYLYQQKEKIALSIGLIDEIPIAPCSSEYDFGDSNKLDVKHEADHPAPLLRQASEITLFFSPVFICCPSAKFIPVTASFPFVKTTFSSQPIDSIFHPPSLG
jgi:hypothetical protein